MTYEQARARLEPLDQAHVLSFWPRLTPASQTRLLRQVAQLDLDLLDRLRAAVRDAPDGTDPAAPASGPLQPAPVFEPDAAAAASAAAAGQAALRTGRVGVVLVAGGQGSRLGFEGPKGCFPIGPVSGASLFYFHARKVLALSRRYGQAVPLCIMTSAANDAETREFFAAQRYFGLETGQVHFFVQGMWPALDPGGRMILERPDRIFMSPDGHGGTLSALERSHRLDALRRRGVDTLFYFQVDNPLVEVADPVMIGLHLQRDADLTLKVCRKRDPDEGLGVVALRDGRPHVIEYTELTDAQRQARNADGTLRFQYGSVAIHVFSLDFVARMARHPLPLHRAFKAVAQCDAGGNPVTPSRPNAVKFEKFIFDVLPEARASLNVAFDRAEEFSPLKNARGVDSVDSCRRDLGAKFARWLRAAGVAVPLDAAGAPLHGVEIDPCLALDARELHARLPPAIDPSGVIHLKAD